MARVLRQALSPEHTFEQVLDALAARVAHAEVLGFPAPTPWPKIDALWEDLFRAPHALGWFQQHWFAPERLASFEAHTARESKHAQATHPTQIYTPRYLADAMVTRMAVLHPAPSSVCDPAMGSGQLLLAALTHLATDASSALEVARALHGVELDPAAHHTARWCLKLELARRFGRCPQAEAAIDAQLLLGDGLSLPGARTFDWVLANPPYMGVRAMSASLKERLRREYSPFHTDLCVAFMRRCFDLSDGAVGLLVQQSVWFLHRFERARRALLERAHLDWFVHLGPHVFEALQGEKAAVVMSVHHMGAASSGATEWLDLREARDKHEALTRTTPHTAPAQELLEIPGAPLAYWIPSRVRALFRAHRTLGEVADIPGGQNKTGANRRFVRRFDEVDEVRLAPGLHDGGAPQGRWVAYSKGGRWAPWWGNWEHVVDWSEEARGFYASNPTSNLLAERYWFRPGLVYTDFGGQRFNARWMPPGCVFDMTGPAILSPTDDPEELYLWLALVSTAPARALLNALNPSIHYQVRDVRNLPLPEWSEEDAVWLAEQAREMVIGVRALHERAPGDPCFVAGASERPGLADEVAGLEARWDAIEARVAGLYGWSPPEPERARLHTIMTKL